MELRTAVIEYVAFRNTSGRKPATILKDEQCLSNLITFFGATYEVAQIKKLDEFFSTAAFLSSSYNNSHVSVFRGFFNFCRHRGYMPLNVDPMYGREQRPNSAKEKKYIPVEQFPVLLDSATDPRDRIIIALGLYLFLRQGEIATLKLSDIDGDRIGVRVWKTNQFDRMQINSELSEELKRWLAVYGHPAGVLVPSKRPHWGKLIYDPTQPFTKPYKAIQRALARMGWQDEEIDGEGGHLLRRSGARALYFALKDQGHERAMALVQRRLHHKNREMTEVYIGVTADDAELDKVILGKPMFAFASQENNVIPLRRVTG